MLTDISSKTATLVQACGLYPLVGKILPKAEGRGGTVIFTRKKEKVRVHMCSVNANLDVPEPPKGLPPVCPLLAYDEVTRGTLQCINFQHKLHILCCILSS